MFLAYESARGAAFIDRALYLPRCWTRDRGRCAAAGIPRMVRFATEVTLAERLLARAFAAGVPAGCVVADSLYGRAHHFRGWLEVRRRVLALGEGEDQRAFRLGWSRWRRAHQTVAQRYHLSRRALALTALPPPRAGAPTGAGQLTDAK